MSTMDDLISRQAAIDTIHKAVRDNFPQGEDGKPMTKTQLMMFSINKSISTAVKALPSAVVWCKDCRWWDQKDDSPYGYCHAAKHAYYSTHWEIGIYRTYKADWFCADGEKKE